MCPDDFMGEFIFDEWGITCNELDTYFTTGILDCEDEDSIQLFASMCCENIHMEHSSYFFSK